MARRAGDEDRRFRQLAAQLGVSRHVIKQEDADRGAEEAGTAESATLQDGDEDSEAEDHVEELIEAEDYEDYEDEELGELSLTLPSDSSEGLSSDLSLPHSFGHYDQIRVGVSHFDDQLSRVSPLRAPFGRANRLQVPRSSTGTGVMAVVSEGSEAVMKKFYEIQVGKIRAQLALSLQAQKEMERTLQQERAAWQEETEASQNSAAQERNRLEKELHQTRAELQAAKTRLKLEKTHFASLQITDALAEQLSRQNEEDLSVREYVQLSVHSKMRRLETELERARKDVEEMEKSSSSDKSAAASAAEEIAQVQRIAESKKRRLENELKLSEATREELGNQIKSLVEQLDGMKEEQRRNEAIYRDQIGLKKESEQLKRDLQVLQSQHDDLKSRYDENTAGSSDLTQKIALLTADKAFLQDTKTQLEDQIAKMRQGEHDMQNEIKKMQERHDTNVNQNTQLQNETRLHFEKKLDDEMARFMELSKHEIDRIRNDGQVVYERENRLLKEARDDALKHAEMLQARLDSVQSSLDEKVLEMTRLESSHTTTLASARNELKMRQFEISQLKLTLEEKATAVRNGKLEVDMLTQKVEAHKEEFARLETTSTTRISQLEATLEVERNKLKEYELLEIDLDGAVVQTGEIAAREETETTTATAESVSAGLKLQEVMTTFGAIPTTTKRRFQQSVLLAQRVVKSQRKAIALEQKLSDVSAERTRLEQELVALKAKLASLHQPQSYLIDKLTRREDELQVANRRCQDAQSQLQQLRAQYKHVQEANSSLQHQLQQLLSRRGDLDALKATVQLLRGRIQAGGHHQKQPQPSNQRLSTNEFAKARTTTAGSVSGGDPLSPSPIISFAKASPPPSIASKMTRPPTPQRQKEDLNSASDGSSVSSNVSSTPKWYTKLRGPMQQQAQ